MYGYELMKGRTDSVEVNVCSAKIREKKPSDVRFAQHHETCYAGASQEMSMQYPFKMVIKRSEA